MKRLFPMGAEEDVTLGTILELFRKMKYEFFSKGQPVYVQGEPSNDKMYIVITGEIGILEKEPEAKNRQIMDKAEFTRRLVRQNSLGQNQSALNSIVARFRNSQRNSLTPSRKGRRGSLFIKNSDPLHNELDGMIEQPQKPSKYQTKAPSVQELNTQKSRKSMKSLTHIDREEKSLKNLQKERRETDLAKNANMLSALAMAKLAFRGPAKRKQVLQRALIKYGNLRMIYQETSYFGEQILFSRVKRNSTALAMKNSDLLVIEKEDFKQIKYLVQEKHDYLKKFIKGGFPLLESYISDRLLEKIMTSMNDDIFHKDQIILSEGEKCKYIYIVYEGTVEVSKGIIAYEPDNQKVNNIDARKKSRTTHKVLLAKLETGMLFGEEAIFYPNMPADFTVKCSSQKAIIYKINFHDFQEKFPEDVITAIFERYEEKLKKYFFSIKYALLSKFTEYEPIVQEQYQNMSRVDKINLIQVHDIKNYICMKKLFTYHKIKNLDYLALLSHQQTEPDLPTAVSSPKPGVVASPNMQSTKNLSMMLSDHMASARQLNINSVDLTKSILDLDKAGSFVLHRPRKSTLYSRVLETSGNEEIKLKPSIFARSNFAPGDRPENTDEDKDEVIEDSVSNFSLARKRGLLRLSGHGQENSHLYEMGSVDMHYKRRDTIQSVRSFTQMGNSPKAADQSFQPLDFTSQISRFHIPLQQVQSSVLHLQSPIQQAKSIIQEPKKEESPEKKQKVDERGEDTKRLHIIQHIRTLTHTHTHIFPLERVHKKIPSYSEDQALTMSKALVKRKWEEYQNMVDSLMPPDPKDEDYICNLENFRADFGGLDEKYDKNFKAAKIHIANYYHPRKAINLKIGDPSSQLKSISHRVNNSLARADKKGFPSLVAAGLVSPKYDKDEDTSSPMKPIFSKKRLGSFGSLETSPIPIENSMDIDSRELSRLNLARRSDVVDNTFVTLIEQSTDQTSNIMKNAGTKKTVNDIIRHKKKINEMIKFRAKLQRPDLNLSKTKYNPKKSVIVQGKSTFATRT